MLGDGRSPSLSPAADEWESDLKWRRREGEIIHWPGLGLLATALAATGERES